MRKFTRWIASKFIKNHEDIRDPNVRARYGALEGWVSVVANILLFLVKVIIGIAIKSVALIADAIHTLSDSASSVVVIIGFKVAKRPSDKEHPFGHGRMESVVALIISVLLFIVGFELFEKSVHSIMRPQATAASLSVILLIAGTIILKELMSRFSYELSDIIDSKALKADALHHRSDAITTILVVVALISSRFGYNRIDGIMGILVSLFIFYSAYLMAKEAINPLLGEPPPKEALEGIEKMAKKHAGVSGVHDIIFHKYGQVNIISLHIEVSDKESPSTLHALSEVIEEEIAQEIGGMVVIHVDPINKEHPRYATITEAIQEIISHDKRINSFHELRIIGHSSHKCTAVFDIVLEKDVNERKDDGIIRYIRGQLRIKFPDMKTAIKVEPKYVYNP